MNFISRNLAIQQPTYISLLALPTRHCLSALLHHVDAFLQLCSQHSINTQKVVSKSKYFPVPAKRNYIQNMHNCSTWHVPKISFTVPSIFLDMDLSLIVLAMLRMSSKERLPLCLTESNYVNITRKKNTNVHKPTIKKKLDTKINLVDKRKLIN